MFIEELVDVAFATPGDDVGTEVREAAVDHVVDTLGAFFVGRETLGARLGHLATDLGFDPGAGGVSAHRRTALIAGACVHAWEADDLHHDATVCPGSVVFPVLLGSAAADPVLDWGCFLDAYRAGYDVVVSAARSAGSPQLLQQGWWPTSLFGPLGAAAALGLAAGDRAVATASIGIAAQLSGGALAGEVVTADSRYLLAGMAADRGVVAHATASSGWVGPADFFDAGRTPFPHSGGHEALASCGDGVIQTSFKPFPAAQHLQAAIEGLLEIVHSGDVDPADIALIECALPAQIASAVDRPVPAESRLAALVTAPFVLASAVLARRLTIAEYDDERRADPRVLRLAERIRIVPDDELGSAYPARWGASVRVTTASRSLTAHRAAARGSRGAPMTSADVDEKFRSGVAPILGAARADEVLRTLRGAEPTDPARRVLPAEALASCGAPP